MIIVKQLLLFWKNFKRIPAIYFRIPQYVLIKSERKTKYRQKRPYLGMFLITLFIFNVHSLKAQIKQINSVTLGAGAYSSAGIASNPLMELRFNRYFEQGKHFFEFSFGLSSVESDVLKTFTGAQLFETNNLFTTQLVYGYDPKMWSSVPYFIVGVANISQGGQSKFALVLGIGNRILIDSLFDSKNFGIRYDIRDHILRQKFNNDKAFTAHNFVLTLNLEYFF